MGSLAKDRLTGAAVWLAGVGNDNKDCIGEVVGGANDVGRVMSKTSGTWLKVEVGGRTPI